MLAVRPLSRSITFWSDILVMAFVCWAWRDSQTHRSSVHWQRFGLMQSHSYVGVSELVGKKGGGAWRIPHYSNFPPGPLPLPFKVTGKGVSASDPDRKGHGPRNSYRVEVLYDWDILPPDSGVIYIPHWLLLLTVALPWSALLFWRVRRGKLQTLLEPTP